MDGLITLAEGERREAERLEVERLPVSDVDSQYGQPAKTNYADLPITLDDWHARKLPERDFLLGSIFTTTTRAMLSAKTGLGKTHLGFAFGFAMAAQSSFCHWRAPRKARVLIVDGEMSVELVKERLADAERRIGKRPESLFMLCKEDAANMLPLDTEEGQRWLDGLIEHLGGIDFLILDNVMALTAPADPCRPPGDTPRRWRRPEVLPPRRSSRELRIALLSCFLTRSVVARGAAPRSATRINLPLLRDCSRVGASLADLTPHIQGPTRPPVKFGRR